jgi:serine/threonine protein kinase
MAKKSPDKDLDYIRDRIQTQFVTTDLDSGAAEEEIANLAERTILVKRRVTDKAGFLKDRKEPPYIELGDFLGAGGQYLVFRGKIHFNKIRDFSRLWIPLTAHQAMEEDGADLTKFMDYTKKLAGQIKRKGLRKARQEVMAFINARGFFHKGECAVKVSFEDVSNIPRVQRETFTIGMYQPSIVFTITEGKTAGNRIYRVMELVPRHIAPPEVRKKLNLDQQMRVALRVAEVLKFIDEKGAVHRDLKPDNIMLLPTSEGVVPKVADFGLMKLREFQQVLTFLTASSCMLLGTPEYIAPEQAENPVSADIRSDIYCLGATAYYWWTGHSPNPVRDNVSPRERVHLKFINAINRERKPAPPLSLSVRTDFLSRRARKYQTVLAGMLVTDPAHRYQTPDEVMEDLRRALDGNKLVARPESQAIMRLAFSPARRKMRLGRLALCVAAGAALLLGGGYLLCNEVPSMRKRLPDWIQKTVPWYRSLPDASGERAIHLRVHRLPRCGT